MSNPFTPGREASRRLANWLTSVELSRGRDVELRRPLSELFVGYRPGLMRSLGPAPIEAFPLFVGSELEVAQLDRGPNVGSRLPEGRSFVATPETEIEHDVGPELQSTHTQPD